MFPVCQPFHRDSVAFDGMTDTMEGVQPKLYVSASCHCLMLASYLAYNCAPFLLYPRIFPTHTREEWSNYQKFNLFPSQSMGIEGASVGLYKKKNQNKQFDAVR